MNAKKSLLLCGALILGALVAYGASKPFNTLDTKFELPDAIQMYKDAGFGVTSEGGLIQPVTGQTEGRPILVPKGFDDNISSLKWNLPSGVVVYFYKDENGLSRHYAIFGKGEDPDLKDNDMKDVITSWAWFRVGK